MVHLLFFLMLTWTKQALSHELPRELLSNLAPLLGNCFNAKSIALVLLSWAIVIIVHSFLLYFDYLVTLTSVLSFEQGKVMESILNEVLLEENRLLLEQFEEIRRQVANLPKQLMEMQESFSNQSEEHVDYIWRQEPQFFYSPPPSHQPPEQDRNTKLEETLDSVHAIFNGKSKEYWGLH